MYTIYAIYNTSNDMRYIGQTVNTKRRRWQHFHSLKKGTHTNNYLQRSYDKYGRKCFKWVILETDICDSETANDREIYWIDLHGFENTYNLQEGGNNVADYFRVPCVWNGVEYISKAEAARANGLTKMQIDYRIDNGYICESDLPGITKKCIWNGVEYNSIREAAEANGISEGAMQRRIKRGNVCDDDVPFESNMPKSCAWNGVEYPSIKEAARALGISASSMRSRVKKGYTQDSDLTGSATITHTSWNGIDYPSISQAAQAIGINEATLRYRISKGYTTDSDLNQNMQRRRK